MSHWTWPLVSSLDISKHYFSSLNLTSWSSCLCSLLPEACLYTQPMSHLPLTNHTPLTCSCLYKRSLVLHSTPYLTATHSSSSTLFRHQSRCRLKQLCLLHHYLSLTRGTERLGIDHLNNHCKQHQQRQTVLQQRHKRIAKARYTYWLDFYYLLS